MTKKTLNIVSLFIIITQVTYAQDCNCKHWKKTNYDNSGHVSYEYEHNCRQPSLSWEFIGYDQAYCDQLVEDEKNRLLNIKRTQEAIEIAKNTKKQEFKDGYNVIDWYGKVILGSMFPVGEPYFGVKSDSSFVFWTNNGEVVLKGQIKNETLDGFLLLVDKDKYFNPSILLLNIVNYYELFKMNKGCWKPDYVYYNETNKHETLKAAISQKHLVEKDYGLYSNENSLPSDFRYYYIKNGRVTIFSKLIDEANANKIHNEIIIDESKEELKKFKDLYLDLKNKIEKLPVFDLNQIKNNPLNEFENNLIGSWDFKSNNVPWIEQLSLMVVDNIVFNKDRKFTYKGDLVSLGESVLYSENNGIWEIKDNRLVLYPFEDSISNKLIDLALIRVKNKLKIIDEMDQNLINSNEEFLKFKTKISLDEREPTFISEVEDGKMKKNKSLIISLFEDEIGKNEDDLSKLYKGVFKNQVINRKIEIKTDKLTEKTIIIKNLSIKETLTVRFYPNSDNTELPTHFGGINFNIKGKKK